MADVVVAGGGPAGALAALLLARAGLAVTFVERAAFPRRKVCGEYLCAGAVERLGRLGLSEVVRACGTPLRGVRLHTAGAPMLELPFFGTALACTRERLDAALLVEAQRAGAEIVRGRVDDLLWSDGRVAGVRVRAPGGETHDLPARWAIGADGIGSTVALRAGLARATSRPPRFAIGGHYSGVADLDAWVEMYARNGAYAAFNPLGPEFANVLLVMPKARFAAWTADIDRRLDDAVSAMTGGRHALPATRRIGSRVAIGPLTHAVRAPVARGLILVGDAAGFLDPFTGQGLYLAFASAESAAAAVASAAGERARETRAFETYARRRGRDVAARERLARLVRLLIDVGPLARRAAVRLERTPALAAALTDALAGRRPPSGAPLVAALGRLVL
jgi:menaquinone-9 beta-reductase